MDKSLDYDCGYDTVCILAHGERDFRGAAIMKITIGKYTIEDVRNGVFYEHSVLGDEKSGRITIDNHIITDLDGDYDIPLPVLAVLAARFVISQESFADQMVGRYEMD